MIFRHSLRFRIVTAFCLFGAVLGATYGTIVYSSLDLIEDLIEDELFEERLRQETEHFLAKYRQNGDAPVPISAHVSAYIGKDSIPRHIREHIAGVTQGFHKVEDGPYEYYIAVRKLPDSDELLYLLYDANTMEVSEKRKLMILIVLIAGGLLIVGLGLWLGLITSRSVIAPVVQLADLVNNAGPGNLPTNVSGRFYDDEVGMLAQALERAMQRVEAFVEREHQFTRDASHELRTPVTVIKGAVELLQRIPNNKDRSLSRPLQRIKRSVNDMECIIETLLWLAREEAADDPEQSCSVVPVVQDTIEQYRMLLADRSVDIEFTAEDNPLLSVPPPVFRIAIANIVRNAFHYTAKGKITVHICKDRVVVSDTGAGIPASDLNLVTQPYIRGKSSQGFGLGLAIVKRLCDRFGWHLEMRSERGQGTIVQLIFLPSHGFE